MVSNEQRKKNRLKQIADLEILVAYVGVKYETVWDMMKYHK